VPTTMMTMAMKGGDEDKDTDANAVATTTMTTTAMTNKDAPHPARGGGDDDVIVVIVDAPYPNKGEAGMAAAVAKGVDGEGGASVVPTRSTMDASVLAGKGKGSENAGANPVALVRRRW
jgi:hypothetical protein